MSALLNSFVSLVAVLATFARGDWSRGAGRPTDLSASDLVYLAAAQVGLILAIGTGMCTLAAIAATTLKWWL